MTIETTAVYLNGVLHPTIPLPLAEDEEVQVTVVRACKSSCGGTAPALSSDEFNSLLEEMSSDAPDGVPALPADFSRADCYADRE